MADRMSTAGRNFFACGGFARPSSGAVSVRQASPPPPPSSSQALPVTASSPASAALQEPLEQYLSKDLRKEVHRLKLRVVRHGPGANDSKKGYMALLRAHRTDLSQSSVLAVTQEDEPLEHLVTIRMLDTIFSDKLWTRLHELYQRVLIKNKSMLSDTVTIPSFDLYGPQQSVEGMKFWKLVVSAMTSTNTEQLDSIEQRITPDRLFAAWKQVCAAYNGVKLPNQPFQDDYERKKELLCLLSNLRRRLGLVTVITVGSFYRTFDPIVPPVPARRREPRDEAPAPDAGLDVGSNDELVVTSDDDCSSLEIDAGVGDAVANDCATVSDTTDGSQTLDEEGVADLKREFWRSKNKLATQNLANAKLQFEIQQTQFIEERLSGSKRRIEALRGDLRANPSAADAICVQEELAFYERERKRLLSALRRRSEMQ